MSNMPNSKPLLRVVVLISGSGSNLQALIDGMQAGELPINIVGVISNKADAYGLQRAQQANIANHFLAHQDFDSRDDFDQALRSLIDQHRPDLVVLAGFMRILTADFVAAYTNRLINIHPSLLPKFTGLNTHQRAIEAGESQHGASVHFVIAELDAGPVIIQGSIPVHADDTSESLQKRVHKIEHIIYPQAVKWIAEDRISVQDGHALLDGHIADAQKPALDC